MFYGTAFMYNHAILCFFSPILEIEINIIIIILLYVLYLTSFDVISAIVNIAYIG